jgi:hypothetical protein
MDSVKITIIRNDKREQAVLVCSSENLTITFAMDDGYSKSYTGDDFYKCFGSLRADHPEIVFLCKGAKVNVHPSSMSSQMTLGAKAYELTLGKHASRKDIVNIFDYEENNLTNDPKVQQTFFLQWMETDNYE